MEIKAIICIAIAILIVCNWEKCENLVKDFGSLLGAIILIGIYVGCVYLAHKWVFDSWLVSVAVVTLAATFKFKYSG